MSLAIRNVERPSSIMVKVMGASGPLGWLQICMALDRSFKLSVPQLSTKLVELGKLDELTHAVCLEHISTD